MLARIVSLLTQGFIRLQREVIIGIEMGRIRSVTPAPHGLLECGGAIDDHLNGQCEDSSMFRQMFEDNDDE